MASIKKAYLTIYNTVLCFGWLHILVTAILAASTDLKSVYAAVELPLQIWQTAAVAEILHSLVGLVRASIVATLPQVLSRLMLTWGILYLVPETREHYLVTSLVLSWSCVEVIRYGFFAVREGLGVAPHWMLWLRYSAFLVLYPTGIASECGLIYVALPHIKESGVLAFRMPNALNFAFDYYVACWAILLSYIPGGPFMYTHMMAQRRKMLSPASKKPKSA